ncbi:flippase-like domain-containing protein [Acidobacteria bacterium AH-259-O06]|nr:flippase-like domain-containing protein [Acidobacteria bacterium AH-259-O06]
MVRKTLLLVGWGLFIYLVFHLGPRRILSMLTDIGWDFLIVGAIFAVYQLVRAGALYYCLNPGLVPYRDLVWIRISGETVTFLTSTGPILAEPSKALLLKERGLSTERAFASILAEYLLYTCTSCVLVIVGLSILLCRFQLTRWFSNLAWVFLFAMCGFVLLFFVGVWWRIHIIGSVLSWIARLPGINVLFQPNMDRVGAMENLLLDVFHLSPSRFLAVLTLELLGQALLLVEGYWILRAMDLVFPLVYPFLIETVSKMVSFAFFFVPGQMGAAEGAYTVVFSILGLPMAGGFTFSFARRLRSLAVAGVGLVMGRSLIGRPDR